MTVRRALGALLFALVLAVTGGRATSAHASTAAPPSTPTSTQTSTVPAITVPAPGGIDAPTVPAPGSPSNDDTGGITISTPAGSSNAVLLIVMITLIAIVPGLLMLCTTFPRFLIVLGLSRQALGLNTTPPNQVLAGLAAFLTFFVMAPVFSQINTVAVQPAIQGEITQGEAIQLGWVPLRDFMLDRTRTSDLEMLYNLTDTPPPASPDDISPRYLIPAFILSELRAAFLIGFLVWVPFLLIDLIVSSILAALGMLMMPPVVVSLPIKLALFVLVDGWALLSSSLLRSAT